MTYYGKFDGQTLTNVTSTTSFDAATPATKLAIQSVIRFDSHKEWSQLTKEDLISGGACQSCLPDGQVTFS